MKIPKNINSIKSNSSKMNQRWVEVKSFYSKHFPTDKRTYNFRLPFIGLALSLLILHFSKVGLDTSFFLQDNANVPVFICYIFVVSGVSYELYYGLKIGDRKQYTPWILLKFIENVVIVILLICILVQNASRLERYVGVVIYGLVILVLNSIVTYIITSKSIKQFRGHPSNPQQTDVDDNIYDNYDNV